MLTIVADENIPHVPEAFGALGSVRTLSGRAMTPDAVRDADVLLVRSITPVNEALLGESKVRFVGTATIGTDHVDQGYLATRGIRFAYAPGSNADSVADYVTAALLTLAAEAGFALAGLTMAVVGVGNVGSRVVRRAEALGMKVIRNDPPLARQTGDASFRPIEDVYGADVITLHVPLTQSGRDATHRLVDAAFLARLKPEAILINTSRGAVVDNAALLAALQRRARHAAILDVWEGEPAILADLLAAAAIGTPHIAGYSFDGKVKGTAMLHAALCDFLGEKPSWTADDVLPPPDTPLVELTPAADDMQPAVARAVRHVYDIRRDDAALRATMAQPEAQRGALFDRLRKQYRVRREISRYRVRLLQEHPQLRQTLCGLGFRLEAGPSPT